MDDIGSQFGVLLSTAYAMLLGGIIGPSMALPQSLISYGGSQDLYDALSRLRQRFEIGK